MGEPDMAPVKRQHLGVFWLGAGNHSAGWRFERRLEQQFQLADGRRRRGIAERGKFDLFFIADWLVLAPNDPPSCRASSRPPRSLRYGGDASRRARRHGVDQLQRAVRCGAHVQTLPTSDGAPRGTSSPARQAAPQLQPGAPAQHDLRYEIAGEFVDVVQGLWRGWDDGAIVADRSTGVFVDEPRCMHSITRDDFSRSTGRSTSRPDPTASRS